MLSDTRRRDIEKTLDAFLVFDKIFDELLIFIFYPEWTSGPRKTFLARTYFFFFSRFDFDYNLFVTEIVTNQSFCMPRIYIFTSGTNK